MKVVVAHFQTATIQQLATTTRTQWGQNSTIHYGGTTTRSRLLQRSSRYGTRKILLMLQWPVTVTPTRPIKWCFPRALHISGLYSGYVLLSGQHL